MGRNTADLELVLFENSAEGARAVLPHGIDTFLVDWEGGGKGARQLGFDTEILPGGPEELRGVSSTPGAIAWCRINGVGGDTPAEIERAIASGARGLFLPMVRSPAEVEQFIRIVDGRCSVGILVETTQALACARDIAAFRLDRVYFGLNDFAISRGGGSIFRAVLDGSVERAREIFSGTCFGFGGVTAVDGGSPVPCAMLIEEMARLDCQFSFLRRSYRRDVGRVGAQTLVQGVRSCWRTCHARGEADIRRDRSALERLLAEL